MPKTQDLPDRIERIYRYEIDYLRALRDLRESRMDFDKTPYLDLLACGRSEIVPCLDGVLVIRTEQPVDEIVVHASSQKSINEYMRTSDKFDLVDQQEKVVEKGLHVEIDGWYSSHWQIGALLIVNNNRIAARSKFDRVDIIGWGAQLPEPQHQAVDDCNSVFSRRNLANGNSQPGGPPQALKEVSANSARELIEEYSALLASAGTEEELQKFLEKHPEIIYPEHIKVWSKFRMGEDFVSDFVFLVTDYSGEKYVFVEIEKSNKKIFTAGEQFTSDFTQAKNQLLDWDTWITDNTAYIRQKLPDLFKPIFHLVMGHNISISQVQRKKIVNEFEGTNRRFSSFDDIRTRFYTIMEKFQ